MIDSGQKHLIFPSPYTIDIPISILHGANDEVVDCHVSKRLFERASGNYRQLNIIANGDHRLSRAKDLELLQHELTALMQQLNLSAL